MVWFLLACGSSPSQGPSVADPHPVDHAHDQHRHPNAEHVHHDFDDPERWSKVFDDPERDAWQKPDQVVSGLDLQPGMVVADIGAGTGYFNRRLATAVGEAGRVIAIDVGAKLVEHMKERAVEEATPQVEARLTPPDASGLRAGEADRVLMVDVYHHIENRPSYFNALLAGLKPGGVLTIVDLTKEAPFGPPVEARLTPAEVKAELSAAGWTFERAIDGLPHQYMLRFVPSAGDAGGGE
ncbi:MAG: methyltransferase domain-containing protein [Myxococcota bacterium]